MKIIAHIKTDFKEKFGIPRQSGLIQEVRGKIIFEKEYRIPEAFRGLEKFSHIWILWNFSMAEREKWSPTVRPPLLGGNKRVGVFATRSPFRPNPIGLSSVKVEKLEYTKEYGPVIHVLGPDLLDGTPIYDIKPYLAYADSHPEALGELTYSCEERKVEVQIDCEEFLSISKEKQTEIIKILEQNPAPSYKKDGEAYGMCYGEYEIKFYIEKNILHIRNCLIKNGTIPLPSNCFVLK